MSTTLLMPKATAVWLVDNTALSFDQIAQFCGLHPLEVKAIADGDAAQGIKGMDPIITGQLTREEIAQGREATPTYRLKMLDPKVRVPETKRKGPRYTPLSKRQDRPNAILWLVRNHAGAQGRADLAPGRHDQVDDRADPRAQALELQQPRADGPGDARASARRSTSTSRSTAPRAARSRRLRPATRCCRPR